ncbi:MAG: threonylcarbamoyl-AMP synthase [Candidatus Marinimicrobia bacterium]|nr:threonylcarbamoyl-AMP synthase [Candidatus Neomarinimicrobiota bacterium]|tara:strand:+ start:5903 stop:6487 length:585 start_codon:yes stop_codon:yes gene_type:complete
MIYNTNTLENLYKASDLLLKGEIIVYPTDTLYGFGVDATNTEAVSKLNHLKNRQRPYSIIVNSLDMLKKYAILNDELKEQIVSILPGPVTIILNKSINDLSPLVTLDLNTVGIRIPDSNFILKVVQQINRPIITTSVNVHGEDALNDIKLINKKYPDINIFQNNVIKDSKGSTIIDFSNKPFKILRRGDAEINL